VHETTQPQNVGQSATVGCFHSWTPDIRELYEVARLDERVVVTD
jgi:lipoprotein-anchoring transpeptidase ErfK/SrfK